jgi:hypothetical protein
MAVGSAFTLFIIPSIYMLIAREYGREAVAGAEPVAAACILPQSDEFKVPVGCSLTAEADCRWTMDCSGSKIVNSKKEAG